MATIEPCVLTTSVDQLPNAEEHVFSALNMPREKVMEDFDDYFEDTRDTCFECLECRGMFKSIPIERIEGNTLYIEGGATFESELLAKVLQRADELVLYVVTLHGCDQILNNPDNDMFESMFYNGWCIGLSMGSHRWIKQAIADRVRAAGRYVGRGWVPGSEGLGLETQGTLFELLDPTQIDVVLDDNMLMRPIMSLAGFMGISDDPEIENDGSDIVDYH